MTASSAVAHGDADPDRLTILRADLTETLPIGEPVDAVVSVATLHWLTDHSGPFRRVHDLLRPGGLFRAEWGGAGFTDVHVEAVPGVADLRPGADGDTLLRTVVLAPVLDRLPSEQHDRIVAEVRRRLAGEGVRYVRLHATARR